VNDGSSHAVLLERVSGTLTLYVDCVAKASGPSPASFSELPPPLTKTDVCVGADGTVALEGEVGSVCLASP
jgi:hypothetical protein